MFNFFLMRCSSMRWDYIETAESGTVCVRNVEQRKDMILLAPAGAGGRGGRGVAGEVAGLAFRRRLRSRTPPPTQREQ